MRTNLTMMWPRVQTDPSNEPIACTSQRCLEDEDVPVRGRMHLYLETSDCGINSDSPEGEAFVGVVGSSALLYRRCHACGHIEFLKPPVKIPVGAPQ